MSPTDDARLGALDRRARTAARTLLEALATEGADTLGSQGAPATAADDVAPSDAVTLGPERSAVSAAADRAARSAPPRRPWWAVPPTGRASP